jgi:Glycosyl transferases group 1
MHPSSIPSRAQDAVLIVYPFCLDHVGHGNIQRCLALSRHLAKSGFAVDLVYLASRQVEPVAEQYAAFRNVHRVVEPWRPLATAEWDAELQRFYGTFEPPQGYMRPPAAFTGLIRALLDAGAYRAVISTYAMTAPIFAPLQGRVLRICDVQDVIHEFAHAHERVTGEATGFAIAPETEAFLWRQFDVLAAITPEDAARIGPELLPDQRVMSVRHAAPSIADACSVGLDDVALYAGSDNASNLQAVTWLLDRVWPLVRQSRPNATLRLAGLICRALPDRVREIPGIELLGFRSDLTSDLAACGVFVAPYLFGSGLKIKVVEAACAGKAIVTTPDGAAGSGLTPGQAFAVHDEAEAFAAATSGLLGDVEARRTMAERALTESRALFSPSACYDIVVEAIRNAPRPPDHYGLSPMRFDLVKTVRERVAPERVVVWGNGEHTRMLIRGLEARSIPVSFIVDKRASAGSVSPEGLPVLPVAASGLRVDDLIVLSSEVFEGAMWKDLADWRQMGGCVLGLYHNWHVSHGLRARLESVPSDVPRVSVTEASAMQVV